MKKIRNEEIDILFEAILSLKDIDECRRFFDDLCTRMQALAVDPAEQTVFISHGDCAEDAEYLASRIRETMGVKEILISYVGPVIGAHSGPGTMALFFLGKER